MSTLVVTNLSLGAGGLPNGSVLTDDIADGAITGPKIAAGAVYADNLFGNQAGLAPIYAIRAWVNFNGTGTVAIRTSGNVSSVTDNGVGDYTVNIATALPDANYCILATTDYLDAGSNNFSINQYNASTPTASACRFICQVSNGNQEDRARVSVALLR